MSLEHQNPGSFRDPYSSVFEVNGRVFRGGVKEEKALLTTEFLESDFYKSNAKEEIIRIE